MKSSKTDQTFVIIRKTIENDDVKSIIPEIEAYLLSSPQCNRVMDILRSINSLLYKANKSNTVCLSPLKDIFDITEMCCQYLSKDWDVPILLFVQCLYHIKRYFLDQGCPDYAKQLCNYYFLLKKEKEVTTWDTQEALVMSNILHQFCTHWESKFDNINSLLNDDFDSYLVWTQFVLNLAALNGGEKLNRVFHSLAAFFQRVSSKVSKSDFQNIVSKVLWIVDNWLSKVISDQECHNFFGKSGAGFFHFIYACIFYISEDQLSRDLGCDLMCLLKTIQHRLSQKNGFSFGLDLLTNILSLPTETFSNSGFYLERVLSIIKKKKVIPEAYQTSMAYLFKMKNTLSINVMNHSLPVDALINVFTCIYKKYEPSCDSSHKKSVLELVNHLYTGLFLVYNSSLCKERLAKVFKNVNSMFQGCVNIQGITLTNSLSLIVSSCVNTIVYYKKAELFSEATYLSKIIWQFILTLPTETTDTDTLKECIRYLISVHSSCFLKIAYTSEAQLSLIAMCIKHPHFLKPCFKAWADIKSLSASDSSGLEITVYDVIRGYKDVLMSEWNCNTEEADLPLLLVHEIQAYAKCRPLHKEPVLAVYRKAAKLVQDKYRLAQILISAIDATTSRPDLLPNTNNFELSVRNIMLFFENQLKSRSDPKVVCLMATLYYQLARCEIMTMRKNTEAEVNLLDIKAPEVPVLQANEGDPLDDTAVPPAFSNLTSDKQKSIKNKLDQSLKYWSRLGSMDVINIDDKENVFASSLTYLKPLGYLFRLYCNKLKEVEAWKALYKIAEKMSISKYQVLAVAELLSVCMKVDKGLIDQASILVKTDNSLNSKSYIHQLFLINLSKNMFLNNQYAESYHVFKSLDVSLVKANFLVYVQLQFLNTRLHSDASSLFNNAPISSLCPAVTVLENLFYLCRFSKWNSFNEVCVLHYLLLEIALFLGEAYENMKYVRYARCYSKAQLSLAQRLALPIRVCQLFLVLASSDMDCFESLECDIKLKGIEAILEFCQTGTCESPLNLCDNPSSPRLLDSINCTPVFLSHPTSCLCPQCSNIEYQILSLQTLTLRANFLSSCGSKSLVTSVFKVGKQLIKFSENKLSDYEGVLLNFAEMKAKFYIAMATTLSLWGRFEKALKYTSLALFNIQEMPVPNLVLQNFVLQQTNCIQWILTHKESHKIAAQKEENEDYALPLLENGQPHTPENTSLPIKTMTPQNNLPITPMFHRRPLVLDMDQDIQVHSVKTQYSSKTDIPTIVLDEPFMTPASKRGFNTDQDNMKMPLPKTCPKPLRSCLVTKLMSPTLTLKETGSKSAFKVFCDSTTEHARKTIRSTAKKKRGPSATTTKRSKPEIPVNTDLPSNFGGTKVKVERKLFVDDAINHTDDKVLNQTDVCNKAFIEEDLSDSFLSNKPHAPHNNLDKQLNFDDGSCHTKNHRIGSQPNFAVSLKFPDSDDDDLCFTLEKVNISEKSPGGKTMVYCVEPDLSVIDGTPPESLGPNSEKYCCVNPRTPQPHLLSNGFKKLNLSATKQRNGIPDLSPTPKNSPAPLFCTPVNPHANKQSRTSRATRSTVMPACVSKEKPISKKVTKSRCPK